MRIRISIIALTLIMGVMFNSCKKDTTPTKTDEEIKLELLAKTWNVATATNSVTIDGRDVTAEWATFILNIGSTKTYTSTNATDPLVWPASGTWDFGTTLTSMVRDDGIDITITVTETTLKLQFDYTAGGGRFEGIEGNWVFNMVTQ